MIDDVREQIHDAQALLTRLDGLLAAKNAPRLPGLTLAKLAVALDRETAKLLDQLSGADGQSLPGRRRPT